MTVHAPGSAVAIGPDASTPAIVLAATIRGGGADDGPAVSYDVAWWDGASRNQAWLAACEVYGPEPEMAIGFRADTGPCCEPTEGD